MNIFNRRIPVPHITLEPGLTMTVDKLDNLLEDLWDWCDVSLEPDLSKYLLEKGVVRHTMIGYKRGENFDAFYQDFLLKVSMFKG